MVLSSPLPYDLHYNTIPSTRVNARCNVVSVQYMDYRGMIIVNNIYTFLNNFSRSPRGIGYVVLITLFAILSSVGGVIANDVTSSGFWSDPLTWGGTVPQVGESVTIPDGVNVIVDVPSIDVDSITVPENSALTFADMDTTVRSRFIDVIGTMTMGIGGQPIDNSVTFVFYDNPILDLPVINVTTTINDPIAIDILAQHDGLALNATTLAIASQPSAGTVATGAAGILDYTPDGSFVGTTIFNYEICDFDDVCGVGTINVQVDDAPPPTGGEGVVSGELMQWHRVTVTFDGPQASEDDEATFWDYRLMVTFTNGQTSYTVPGFFAADGDAANTSATSGNKWRVHFTPDAVGEWTYTASFRSGDQIAISLDPNAGTPESFDGASGAFTVSESTASEDDFRYHGTLRYIGGHHLQFAGSGEYFLKGGADSPENFLGYVDFDGTFDLGGLGDGVFHEYAPHIGDWRPGDPTWGNDQRGQGIIGALNYLADQGVNSYYFITYNIDGGDGADTWPWTSPTDRETFDISKLDQWEIVFSHMTARGIQLHFLTQETENDRNLGGSGSLNEIRQLYYREMVARFAHHPALQWNLGEENNNSDQQRMDFAAFIRSFDAYNHPITVHSHYNAPVDLYDDLVGDPNFEATSIQGNADNYNAWAIQFRNDSTNAGRPWAIYGDEQGPAVNSSMNNVDRLREEALWGNLMGGGAGVEWYFGYQGNFGDVQTEDFRVAQPLWDDTAHALDFFQMYLPFWEMTPDNNLVSDGLALAKVGEVYAVYLEDGGSTSLNLADNRVYDVFWYNPRTGGALQTGSVAQITGPGSQNLGTPPSDNNQDWAILVQLSDDEPDPTDTPDPTDVPDGNESAFISVTSGAGLGASTFDDNSFFISNTGEVDITNVSIDLSTAFLPDVVFDPVGTAGDSVAKCLKEGVNSVGDVGYVGNADGNDADDCEDIFAQFHNGVDVQEGYDVITLDFTDFNPNEAFAFGVDIDPTTIKGDLSAGDAGSVSGFELIGATITVEFANGTVLTSSLTDEGTTGGSQAVVEAGLPAAPSIAVQGVTAPAAVQNANQTIVITGTPNQAVNLLQVDARLHIDPGNPGVGYDIDPFEANETMTRVLLFGIIPADGTLELPVTLLATDGGGTPDGGLNHFIAFYSNGANQPFGLGSNVVVLELDSDGTPPDPTDTPEPTEDPNPSGPRILRLILVNADNNTDIGILNDGDILNLAALPTNNFSIRAETEPNVVGSVAFNLNGTLNTENVVPYALGGDVNGNYNGWTPNLTSYTLTVTPYTDGNASGTAGETVIVNFEVINEDGGDGGLNQAPVIAPIPSSSVTINSAINIPIMATDANGDPISLSVSGLPSFLSFSETGNGTGQITGTASVVGSSFITVTADDGENSSSRNFTITVTDNSTPPDGTVAVTGFTLIDASTGADIQPLQNGESIDVNSLPTTNLAVRADVSSGAAQEVVFDLNGATSSDNSAPFSVPVVVGNVNLSATPYQAGELTSVNTANYGYDASRANVTIPANAVRLNPGDDVQAIVENSPNGTAFVFSPGVYRMNTIIPKDGQQFYGEPGAVISGARLLTDFQREGNYWVATNQTQQTSTHGPCLSTAPRCDHAEDLYFDSVPLRHVNSLGEVGPGSWFFDYNANKIYFADDPTGRLVETSINNFAFDGNASNVVISNLTIEKYATPAQRGAINGDDSFGWVVQHNIIQLNHGRGLRTGHNMYIFNNYIVDNGQMGVGGQGDNMVVEWNDIARNNYAGYDDEWEAGGTKFARTDNLLVRHNYVYENLGPGLWTDIDNINTTYDSNLIMNNLTMGLFHEISYDAIIRNNVSMYNAITDYPWLYGAQILISSSSNAEVYNNRVVVSEAGGNGITALQQNRGSSVYGEYRTSNNYVHDNIIVHLGGEGINGIAADWQQDSFYTQGNNLFDANTYYVAQQGTEYWVRQGGKDFEEFQAVGQETNGTVFYNVDTNSVVAGTSLSIQFTLTESQADTAPTAPSGLTAQAPSSDQVELAWTDNADNESMYEIERDGTSLTVLPVDSTVYFDANLAANTEYCYRVRALNDTGESTWTSEVCVTTASEPVETINPPTNPVAQAVDSNQIEFTWVDNADNETMVEIERDGVGLTVLPVDSIIYFDTSLTPETQYCYRVRAVNDTAQSAWSDSQCATTLADDTGGNNQPPTLNSPNDQTNNVGDSVSLQLTYNDPENGVLRFTATDLPDGLSIDETSGLISGTPTVGETRNVTVTAIDDGGLSASISFTWTIVGQGDGNDTPNSVTAFILVDADSNQDIMQLTNGVEVNLNSLPSNNLNIRARTTDGVESVVFGLNDNSNFSVENTPHYAMFGNDGDDYFAWSPSAGTYTVSATPFTEDNGSGNAGNSLSVSFTVVTGSEPPVEPTEDPTEPPIEPTDEPTEDPTEEPTEPPAPTEPPNTDGAAVTQFVLVDADSNQDIMVLTDGMEISLSSLPSREVNIRADVRGDVESVRFGLNNNLGFSLENVAPYALTGDDNSDYYGWTPNQDTYTLTATPYASDGGNGNAGTALTITITFTP